MTSECYICLEDKSCFEVLPCNHSLCSSCYHKLRKSQCPFCRESFIKKQKKPKKHNSNLPRFYIPEAIASVSQNILPEAIIDNSPFSRALKNRRRKRRRNLSLEEVLFKRQLIRKRSRMKWNKKNRRRWKETRHFNP